MNKVQFARYGAAITQGPIQPIESEVLEALMIRNSPLQAMASNAAQTGMRGWATSYRRLYWELKYATETQRCVELLASE